jgi:hypothetical protein
MEITMRFLMTLLLTAILGSAVAVGGSDPILGTWKLNVAKSKFSSVPAPQSQTRVYEMSPDGVMVTTTTIDAHGKSSITIFPAKYDGKPYPVNGLGEATAMALRKVDERTAAITLSHAGSVVATAERIISVDGNTMTITNKKLDPPAEDVSIYEKQ